MPEAVIVVDGLVCRYAAIPALDGVSLSVSAREMCGVIGPNGSGKTTLLRAIDGLISPERGVVLLEGRAVGMMSSRQIAALIGVVPQRAGTGFGFTVREMVAMGRSPHLAPLSMETGRDALIVGDAMGRTGMLHLADRPIDSLSGGEFQRVLIARALAQEPRVLLLDEPTAHLDLRYQREIMGLLSTLCRSGLALIAALHDVNLAAEYCDRLVLLSGGRIAAMGTPAEVLEELTLEQVFEIPVRVGTQPGSGRPYVFAAKAAPITER
jgi:iron complex transport system ATP-binding protein